MRGKYIYISNYRNTVREGGMSRNVAFYNYLKGKNFLIINAYHKIYLIRFINNFILLLKLFYVRDKKIIIHQSSIILLFPIFTWKIMRNIYKLYLEKISSKNKLYIEVNDLPIEQAKDLDLIISNNYVYFQDVIYSLKDTQYIYASYEMEKYNRLKYSQNKSNNQVIINGGNELKNNSISIKELNIKIDSSKINIIYAGSLNKGRQIEWLIDIFNNLESNLLLLGESGNWINSFKKSNNVSYLGEFSEDEAQIIASHCDLGIVPYDDNRFYYNLCYPTKNSFYICSGIPFLSTKLRESYQLLNSLNVAYFLDKDEFVDQINNLTKEKIYDKKKNVNQIMPIFSWDKILNKLVID